MALHGLTNAAAKLLGEMADDFRNRKPDLGRRTRRQYPGGGRGKLILMQYTDTGIYLGSNDQTGVQAQGTAEIVDSLITGVGANDGTEYDIDATYCPHIIAPDGYVWARQGGEGVYYAVCGAPLTLVVSGEVNSDGNVEVDGIAVTYGNPCGTTYVEGQTLTLLWTGNAFIVIDECCPPSP